jgi:hypothetical protein
MKRRPFHGSNGITVLEPEDSRDGWKGPESRLCDAAGGRWSHRQSGYVMSTTKAQVVMLALGKGWDATSILGLFIAPDGTECTYREAKQKLQTTTK